MAEQKLNIVMFGHKRIPSREGGIEIVVEELATRMAEQGHHVTVLNRRGKPKVLLKPDGTLEAEYKVDIRPWQEKFLGKDATP